MFGHSMLLLCTLKKFKKSSVGKSDKKNCKKDEKGDKNASVLSSHQIVVIREIFLVKS